VDVLDVNCLAVIYPLTRARLGFRGSDAHDRVESRTGPAGITVPAGLVLLLAV
jgi:hypothetical protein